MAPTRPLVAQQIEACHSIVGIPQDDTCEMTGQQNPQLRKKLWNSHRVFFCTPQILVNDLKKNTVDPEKIVCVIIDEAHKATGK